MFPSIHAYISIGELSDQNWLKDLCLLPGNGLLEHQGYVLFLYVNAGVTNRIFGTEYSYGVSEINE